MKDPKHKTAQIEKVKDAHYQTGKIQVWDFINDQKLCYFLGNVVKYACRARHKGQFEEDIRKIICYCEKLLDLHKKANSSNTLQKQSKSTHVDL